MPLREHERVSLAHQLVMDRHQQVEGREVAADVADARVEVHLQEPQSGSGEIVPRQGGVHRWTGKTLETATPSP